MKKEILLCSLLVILFCSCESISKSTISLASDLSATNIRSLKYAILPISSVDTRDDIDVPTSDIFGNSVSGNEESLITLPMRKVQIGAEDKVATMSTAKLMQLFPEIVGLNTYDSILQDMGFPALPENQLDQFALSLDAEALIRIYISEYNASFVSISMNAVEIATGKALWSADVTARVGYISLDTDSAAEKAVDTLSKSLRRELKKKED